MSKKIIAGLIAVAAIAIAMAIMFVVCIDKAPNGAPDATEPEPIEIEELYKVLYPPDKENYKNYEGKRIVVIGLTTEEPSYALEPTVWVWVVWDEKGSGSVQVFSTTPGPSDPSYVKVIGAVGSYREKFYGQEFYGVWAESWEYVN